MNRNLSVDILKIMFAVMVIGLHGEFLKEFSEGLSYLSVNGVFRLAVPFFFVISGYYFYDISSRDMVIKWEKRILALYIFWMAFYAPLWFRVGEFALHDIARLLKNIIFGFHHWWYLIGVLGAGVMTFLLRDKVKTGLLAATVCFTVGVLIQYSGNYHVFDNTVLDEIFNKNVSHRNFIFFGFPYFFSGFLLAKYNLVDAINKSTIKLVFLVGIILLLAESYFNFKNPLNDGGFDNFISLSVVVPSLVILSLKSKRQHSSNAISLISTAVYFIHPFWLSVLRRLTELTETWQVLFCILLSLFSSFIIIGINKKLKFIL